MSIARRKYSMVRINRSRIYLFNIGNLDVKKDTFYLNFAGKKWILIPLCNMNIGLVFLAYTIFFAFWITKGHLYFITLKVSTKSTAAVQSSIKQRKLILLKISGNYANYLLLSTKSVISLHFIRWIFIQTWWVIYGSDKLRY